MKDHYRGIELNHEYIAIADRRVASAEKGLASQEVQQRQMSLF